MKKIDFSNNLNALRPPGKILNLIKQNFDIFLNYDGQEADTAIESISKKLTLPINSVAWCNGSTQAFFTLPRVLKNGKVLIVGPTFWEYPMANHRVKENEILFHIANEDEEFKLNYEKLANDVKNSKVVYLCNPNNPTSILYDNDKLISLIESNSEIDFVVDETYLLFRNDYDTQTLTSLAYKLTNLYVVTSFSKFFALPGIRMAFIVSNPKNITEYKKFDIPYLHNPLANVLIPVLLNNHSYINKTRNYYAKERIRFYGELMSKNIKGLRIFRPDANFIIVKILSTDRRSGNVVDRLAKKGLIIRDASIYKGLNDQWLRFSIRTRKENQKLLDSLLTK